MCSARKKLVRVIQDEYRLEFKDEMEYISMVIMCLDLASGSRHSLNPKP